MVPVPGIPKTAWKMKQQSGRIGRGGEKSLDITLVFPQKGKLVSILLFCSLSLNQIFFIASYSNCSVKPLKPSQGGFTLFENGQNN